MSTLLGAIASTATWPKRIAGQAGQPTATDDTPDYEVGSRWTMTDGRLFVCYDATSTAAKWLEVSSGQYVYEGTTFTTTSTSAVLLTSMTLSPGVVGDFIATMAYWGGAGSVSESVYLELKLNETTLIGAQWEDKAATSTNWEMRIIEIPVTTTGSGDSVDWMAYSSNVGSTVSIFERACWLRRVG